MLPHKPKKKCREGTAVFDVLSHGYVQLHYPCMVMRREPVTITTVLNGLSYINMSIT